MKKLILIISCLVIPSMPCFSGIIKPEKAAAVAKNFFYERYGCYKNLNYEKIQPCLVYQKVTCDEFVYYAFQVSDIGFVLVSADDRVVPVLGYSFESKWRNDPLPVQLIGFLDNCELQILNMRKLNLPADDKIRSDWERLSKEFPSYQHFEHGKNPSVDPLLFSKWCQTDPYNYYCPYDTASGSRTLVGCTAIAMAQIMYYYRWPETGVGSNGYWSYYNGYLYVDFSVATYEWDKMINVATSLEDGLAIATLCYHCGVSAHMYYTPYGSSAMPDSAACALKDHFRYSQDLQLVEKVNYSDSIWANMLRVQLDAGKPILYYGMSSDGGHIFVCDGYQDGDYFHFNWGWAGWADGYYYLNNLNPGGQNYTNGQEAVINIFPEGDYPPNCTGTATFTSTYGSVDDGSGSLNYNGNNDCYYLISPLVDPMDSITNIVLDFDRFETVENQDILSIYDGATINAPLIGTYSGNLLPSQITSDGTSVLLHFTTDNSIHGNGWVLNYKSQRPAYCQGTEVLTDFSGVLEDGSGTKQYNNNTQCYWIIQPPGVQLVTLGFSQFSLGNVDDFVEVYDYDPVNMTIDLLGHFTGNTIPPELNATKGAVMILFQTDANVRDQGWSAHYTSEPVNVPHHTNTGEFLVFPNPADHVTNIVFTANDTQTAEISLITLYGIEVSSCRLVPVKGIINQRFDLRDIPKGVYVIRLVTHQGNWMRKLVIE